MAYSSDFTKQVTNGTYGKKKKNTNNYVDAVLNGTYKSKATNLTRPKVTFGQKEKQPTRLAVPTIEEAKVHFKKEEDKPWYQEFFKSSSAFKDGYDFGDVTKTVGSSAADAVLNVGGGILGVVEGITDLATYGTGEVLDLFGADNAAEKVKAAGKKSWVDSLLDQPKHHFNQNSIFGDTSDAVFQGVGTTLGFYAGGAAVKVAGKAIGAGANALSKAGTALSATDKATKAAKVANAAAKVVNTTAKATDKVAKVMQSGNVALKLGKHSLNVPIAVLASASGSGISEAYSKGNVEDWQAWTSGVGSGVIEGMAEGMFGMFGIGGSSLDDALTGAAMSQFKSGFAKGMAKVGVQALGEGSEEVVSYLGNYLLNHGVDFASQITGDTDVKLGEDFSWEDLAENFVVGAASAFLMGGAGTTVDVTKAQNNAIKAAEESLGRKLTAEEKKSVKKQTSLQLMQDTEAEMLDKKSESEQKLVDNYVNSKVTELTKQKAIESELEKAIKTREAEQGGTLTARNKEALKQSIMAKIESGEIDISGTKIDKKDLKKIQAEVEANLENGKYDLTELEDVLTPEKTAQLKELETQLSKTKSEAKKAEIQDQINNLVASKATDLKEMLGENKYLNTAVYESLQSTESYKYEESQVQDEYVKGVYESAKTHANNTTETRNFVENVAKLAKDRKTSYRFTNNQELKEQGDLLERENLSKDELAQITALEAKLAKARTEAEKKRIQNQIDEIKYYDIGGFVRKNVDGVETVLLNIDSKQSMSAVVGHETKHLLEKNNLNKDFNKILFDYAKSKGDYDTYKKRVERLYDGKADIESELAATLTGDYLFTDSKFVETLLNSENKTLIQKIKDLINDLIVIFKGTPQEKQLRELQKKFKELYKQQSQTVSATQETNTQYSIQGLEDYTEDEIKSYASDYIQEKLEENDIYDVTIKDMAINGSRGRGTARTDSDLDIVVEYEGDIREDDMFEILNEEQLEIDGISVDINPITATRSGTLEEYMKRSKAYDKKVLSGSETKYSLTDNQGRELTKEQQEYFKDSKIRDGNGNLEIVYHSTPNQFTVFDNNMSGENTGYDNTGFGTFVTNNKAFSERFKDIDNKGEKGNTMELYANVTNPITHPYRAELKYGEEQANKIVEDYYNALGDKEALVAMQELVENEEADSLYDAYMQFAQSENIYEYASTEKETLQSKGYDAVEIIEGYEHELVEGSKSDEVVSSYAIFNSNQLKNTDNANPTSNPDIRYSLSDNAEIQVYNAVRIDEKNANLDAEAKPHGLYLSNLYETDFNEFESPFARQYEGGERHNFKVEPKNPLIVKTITLDNAKYKYRAGGMIATLDADASLSALKELVDEQEFIKVSEMNKKELVNYLNDKFNEYDFSNYYDKAELLMAYGSVEARNRGYDAIITERSTDPDTADIDNEIVVLKNDILKTGTETRYSLSDNTDVNSITDIKEKYKDKTKYLFISENADYISIDNMVVKEELRKQGIGQNILNDVIKYANKNNKVITLTPTSEFNTQNKLKKWYKANGFVENKGRNKDFLIRDTMYKLPDTSANTRYSLSVDDYGMQHRPSTEYGDGSNFEENMPGVFEHPEWYFYGSDARSKRAYNESWNALKKVRNNPEGEITIYRATTGDTINEGDWVTASKTYAEIHNDHSLNGKGKIIALKVKAKDIRFAGDDLNEFGYFPNGVEEESYSLAPRNQAISPIGDYNIYGRDMKVQEELDESEATEVSEVGNRLEEDTTRIREEATREVGELKAELNTQAKSVIQENLGLDDTAVNDIINKLNSKDTVTEQDVYDAFEGHRQLVEPISDEMLQERQYIKDYLKGRKINLGKAYKSDVNAGEFNDFRRKYFGKTNFVLNGGENIDVAYMELSEVFPHLFPAEITHPADQAIQIASVLDEAYGPKTTTYELTDADLAKTVNEIYGSYTVIENYRNIYKEKYGVDIFETPQNANTDTLGNEASNLSSDTQNASKRVKLSETDAIRNDMSDVEIAEVLADEPVTPKKKDRKLGILAASILDKGLVFENLSLKTKNRFLMAKWDYTLTSNARAQNVIGQGHYEYDPATKTHKKVSDSLDEIRAKVANAGLVKEFYYYMYNNLNMDRMSLESRAKAKIKELRKELSTLTAQQMQGESVTKRANEIKEEIARLSEVKNKPVFGDKITAEMSQERVKEIEAQHPEFADYAKSVYDYERAERQLLVKGGVISQETADLWEEMYPHFVPIRRVDKQGPAINVALDTGRTGINAPIQRATGGNTDILPLFDTMAQRTLQTHRAVAKNSFGVELKNTLDSARTGSQASVDEIIDSVDMHEGLLKEGVNGGNPTFTVFENGERVTYEITQEMYDALKPLSDSSLLSKTSKVLNTASSFHRGVLTQYNPVFMLTNAIKDVQDVLINSQHPFSTYKKLPEAYKQLRHKGYWYQEYMANGGEQNSYFDSQDNTFDTERKGISKVLDWFPLKQIANMNDFVEMIPRLAEYIASREMGRSVEVSMLDAARVTTNFKAGGDLTKFLNRNGVTFLNASVQGAMQQARNIREANANGFKGWAMLATKFAVASVPVAILNALLWSGDDEYEELSEYVKENYYIVGKYGDGNFIRIPKGRTVAVIQDALNQIVDVSTGDDEADLKGFLELMATNLAPNNPIENNILSPIVQVATNKAWYGEDLVPQRLQDKPSAEQYDESTDMFSRWLGEKLNVSPIKVNYLLDQYTGGVGDVVLPMMTPEATSGTDSVVGNVLAPLTKKFTTNSIMNNQNVSDFYSTSEELTTEAKKANATDEDILRNKYINSVKAEMNELYAEKRKIQNSSLPKSEKWEKVQAVQKQINELSKKGLDNYEKVDDYGTYATVGDREYYKRINSDGEEEWTKVKDKEAQELNELGLTKSQKDTYFSTKIEISNIVNDYKDDKEILVNMDEDSDEYKDAVAKLSSDKKASIASMVKNTNLNDEQKAYLYKKYYNSDTIDTLLLSGVSMNAYLDFASQDIRADVNKYGKTISGSKKEKVEEYINSMRGINYYQKIILFKSQYKADDRYNSDIIDYLNEREDISYNDMVYILKELGFTVKNDKISW